MNDYTITIVGAGVIGTSMGLALKREQEPPRVLVHDRELGHAQAAVKKGAFDKAEWNLINACEKADLIILAIPLDGIRPTLEAIAPDLKEGVVITDTARSKTPVLAWAKELLPGHAHFIGGDPVVHPSGSGYEHAAADLFRNRMYCLTPAATTDEGALQVVSSLVAMLGAEPFFIDEVEHDGLVTAVEHLPSLVSVALLNTLSSQSSWREMRKMAGALFEQVSAGAGDEPAALKDNLVANRANLVRWLDSYMRQLNELRTLIEAEDRSEELGQLLDKAVVEQRHWAADYKQGTFTDPELVAPKVETQSFMKRLIGLGR